MVTSLHLSLAEFDSMVRVGAFDRIDRKIELVRGELVAMNPAGPVHDDLIIYLNSWSARSINHEQTFITSQTGLDLPESQSRPEPDLMWVRAGRYRDAHPRGGDVQLAIEVSYSSLAYDLDTKRRIYAESKIQEYWIVDAEAHCIHVNRNPRDGDYTKRFVCNTSETLSPIIKPEAILDLNDLFFG